jgi:copper transport protein
VRVGKRFSALILFALIALVGMAVPAFAHAELESSDPAAGAQLAAGAPPTAITLRFTEPVQIPKNGIRMFDSDARAVALGEPTHGDSSSTVTVSVPRIDDGTYVVSYRIVSADSHPISGGFTFSVGTPTANSGDLSSLIGADQGSRAVGIVFGIDRTLAFLSVLVFVGGIAFIRLRWPEAAERKPVIVLLMLMWALGIVTAIAGIGLQAAYSSGRGFGAMFDTELLRQVLRSHFGEAWLMRAVLMLALYPFARRPTFGRGTATNVALGIAGVALLATISYAGHATTGRWVPIAFVTDLLHLTGGAAWLGGLSILALALCVPAGIRGTSDATTRFSQIALPAMGLIALTGVLQGVRQIDNWSALVETSYGRLLLAKVFCVGIIVVAASASRDIVRQRIPQLTPAVGPGAAPLDVEEEGRRSLRDAILIEIVVAIVVLALTAVLVNTEPARGVSGGGTYSTTVQTETLWFDVTVTPASPGTNRVNIVPRQPDGGAASLLQMTAQLSNPERDIAPFDVLLSTAGPFSTSYAADVSIPFAGDWVLDIRALVTDVDEVATRVTVPIS